MSNDIIGKATNIMELALIAGIAYIGYKTAVDLGLIGKKPDGKTPDKKLGETTPTGGNPVLDYFADQNQTVDLTGLDMSKLTPTVETPLGPVGGGIPSVVSGPVGQVINGVANPIMSAVWEAVVKSKYGDNWRERIEWVPGRGWVEKQYTGPVSPVPEILKPSVAPKTAIEQVRTGGFASILAAPAPAPAPQKSYEQQQYEKAQASPVKSASMGGTGIFNSSLGQVIRLDQMMPEDRVTMEKTAEQMLRDYGTTGGLPMPTAAPEAPKPGVWWIGPQRQVLRSPEGTTGWRMLSQQEAANMGYY